MALDQQSYLEAVAQHDSCEQNRASIEKWKSFSATVDGCEDNPSSGFACNICLDPVMDPVVTLCGHLYCWPCIYKWIHFQSFSVENSNQKQAQCPVCKAEISESTLVPLYGRGQTVKSTKGKAPHLGIVVPRRPPSPTCGVHTRTRTALTTGSDPSMQLHHHPMVGMYGEMVYARIFGNSETTLYTSPNSYHLEGSSSPRVRRHIMQADKSLGRVCFFLFCCIVLCLLLF